MIGAPPAQDEQARLSGARGDFVASLPRRLEVLRAALRAVEDQPRDPGRINGLLRRLHALGSAARVLGFASVAEALGEAEKTLRRVAKGGPAASDLADIARALDLLPSLVLGAKVSLRAVVPSESLAAPLEYPLSVLVFGPQTVADMLQPHGDLRVECERTEEPGKARELSRVFGPDVAVIDADRKGARELIELFVKDPVVEPIPIVVIGDFSSPELSMTFLGLGAARVLPKPVSPDQLRRVLFEVRDPGNPAVHAREPLGELTVNQLVDRIALEVRRGLVESVEPVARSSSVEFGEGTDVLSAVWATVARLRELVTLRSDGNVRFEQTGPEGAVPLAPWSDDRRVGERAARDGRAGEGVSLQGRRVVVADDDPAVVWFLSGILKTVGAEVFEAHDGERAFELTASLWPDLVVSDVLMPKLDGFSLCHEIKRDVAVRDVPVILLSWKEDLLQRVRELGGDADGYLRKEAAASTVVERLREVLRPRARVEARVASSGEVRGRLDGLTPRLVLELACRAQRDSRVSVRDSSYLYEVQVRAGEPRAAIRSASDGSFERGEAVLSMLLGVSAGRFAIEPDVAPCRAELSGTLYEQLAAPVARARAAQRALSAGALASVTRVVFDAARVGGYLQCTPEPAQSLLRELITGASPRDLLTSGRAPARLLEAVLSDFARRGGILLVETAGGIEDISQTRVPPLAAADLPAVPQMTSEPEPNAQGAATTTVALAEQDPEAVPAASQHEPASIPSEGLSADAAAAAQGWFSFQLEASAQPPEAAEPAPAPPAPELPPELPAASAPLARSEDPLRKTLTSTAPPRVEGDELPGASVPVERGHRPEYRANTLGSAGNEAAAAAAALAEESTAAVAGSADESTSAGGNAEESTSAAGNAEESTSAAGNAEESTSAAGNAEESTSAAPAIAEEPASAAGIAEESTAAAAGVAKEPTAAADPRVEAKSVSTSAPSALPPGSTVSSFDAVSPIGSRILDEDPLAQALLVDTPPPLTTTKTLGSTAPLGLTTTLSVAARAPAPSGAVQTLPLSDGPAPRNDAVDASAPAIARSSEVSKSPPTAAPRPPHSKALARTAAAAASKPAAVPASAGNGGGWVRTALFSLMAAAASYYVVTVVFGAQPPEPTPNAEAPVAASTVHAMPITSAAAPEPSKPRLTVTESALPPGTDVPAGDGLLDIQVPDGTPIRVDGEYLGMGPARRVPLKPGEHELGLGDGATQRVLVKAGQRTLAVAAGSAAPAGSP